MDVVDMYSEYPHIGNEFLTWMWFKGETDKDFQFSVGNKIVFSKDKDTVTIKGDESELIIGKVAMSDGYIVSDMQIVYSSDEPRFTFSMKGKDLSFNSLKTPKIIIDENEDDEDGYILEKVYLINEIASAIDNIFKEFILERVNRTEWDNTVQTIKLWINEG